MARIRSTVRACRASHLAHRPTRIAPAVALLAALALALVGCGHAGSDDTASEAPAGGASSGASTPGIGATPPASTASSISAPRTVASVTTARIDELAPTDVASIVRLTARCDVTIASVDYRTVGGAGEPTTATTTVMTPSGSDARCRGPRPIVLYARGTATDRRVGLTDPDDGETALVIAFFAAQGAIVVAPSYAGYEHSDLPYHPYLNASQQSRDMLDALAAARSALPLLGATASGALAITGYSEGGHVAMATHRALEARPDPSLRLVASVPMSGPYALSHTLTTVFAGTQMGGAAVFVPMLIESMQRSYGDVYASPAQVYAPPYDTFVPGLLPSDDPGAAKARLPAGADGTYRTLFDRGDGQPFLIRETFRVAALQPGNRFMADVARNDLLDWAPRAPMALCLGSNDPVVFGFNASDAQAAFAQRGVAVPRWDLEDASTLPASRSSLATAFSLAKGAARLQGGIGRAGDEAIAERYHAGLVPPFCFALARDFIEDAFDRP